jgi:hypothetical protein
MEAQPVKIGFTIHSTLGFATFEAQWNPKIAQSILPMMLWNRSMYGA